MYLWAIPFAMTAFGYLFLGTWVMVRRKSNVDRLYGLLCLTTCLWQGIWAVLFAVPGVSWRYLALRCCYSGIVLAPPVFYHFIMEFTGQEDQKSWLFWSYAVSLGLAASIWIDHLFLNGFNRFSWGLAARGGPLHPVFTVLVMAVILRALVLLNRMPVDAAISELKRRQTFLVKLATSIYCGGAIDLVSQYGFSMFPLSFIFSGVAMVLFGYAMFHYEFLAIAVPRESDDERLRREAASMEMSRQGMAAAFPLVSQGELLGYLLLGEKMSEESYSKEDLLLLRIVANQAALGYQRVRYLEMAMRAVRTEMLGEIAGGFAHEIRTPLANISLPAELTLIELNRVETGERALKDVLPGIKARMTDIMDQTRAANEKIEAIRQFSKPGHEVRLEPVDLTVIFRNSLTILRDSLQKIKLNIQVEVPPVLSPIRGDAKQLEIVFMNLIKNAAEAMSSTHMSVCDLWLKGREEGDWIIATVKDSGPGITRSNMGHLFEAYFTTKGSAGTGVGLFLSHQVIKAHGGFIQVKSEEGQGTEFVIRLPKYAAQAAAGIHQAA